MRYVNGRSERESSPLICSYRNIDKTRIICMFGTFITNIRGPQCDLVVSKFGI